MGGKDFRTLTDRDLKDLVPVFKLRKNLREWVQSLVSNSITFIVFCAFNLFPFNTCQVPFLFRYKISGGSKLIPWTESNDLSYGSDKDYLLMIQSTQLLLMMNQQMWKIHSMVTIVTMSFRY